MDAIESVQIAEGLSSKTLLQGDGAVAEIGHTAVVHYTGWLYDPEAADNRGTKLALLIAAPTSAFRLVQVA